MNAQRTETFCTIPGSQPERDGERQLIFRVARGDRIAFDALYRVYRGRLTHFVGRLVRHPHLVEEVLDDTLMVVWEHAADFKGESKLSTWIFAIAYRKAMRALRRYDVPFEDVDADFRASGEAGPEEIHAQSRLHDVLQRALVNLSADHRAVIELTYFHDLGYREIAEIMDCPVDTVKTRMFYARRHLKGFLDGELPDWI